ncbi:MAG: hypothetical protein ACE15B_07920 [Bryobacteraceae bacterium]
MSPLLITIIAWAAVTVVFVILMIYRSLIAMHEDDQLFLGDAPTQMEAEQQKVVRKLERLSPYTKGFGFASLGLLMLGAGIWVYQALQGFNAPR